MKYILMMHRPRTGYEAFGAMPKKDRILWNQEQIAEGVALISAVLQKATIGAYQLQAAIARSR